VPPVFGACGGVVRVEGHFRIGTMIGNTVGSRGQRGPDGTPSRAREPDRLVPPTETRAWVVNGIGEFSSNNEPLPTGAMGTCRLMERPRLPALRNQLSIPPSAGPPARRAPRDLVPWNPRSAPRSAIVARIPRMQPWCAWDLSVAQCPIEGVVARRAIRSFVRHVEQIHCFHSLEDRRIRSALPPSALRCSGSRSPRLLK
jgi:hypothetical protein